MLKRITNPPEADREGVRISDASFDSLFPRKLEYNAPAHGAWNIVHITMAVPESHSIYVCSDNCLRGVVMTAAEMGCSDRFSSVMLRERNVQVDNLESITIEGVSDVLEHLEKQPPLCLSFLSAFTFSPEVMRSTSSANLGGAFRRSGLSKDTWTASGRRKAPRRT